MAFSEPHGSPGLTILRLDAPTPPTAGRALVAVALVRGRYLVLRHPWQWSVPRPAWRIESASPTSIVLLPINPLFAVRDLGWRNHSHLDAGSCRL